MNAKPQVLLLIACFLGACGLSPTIAGAPPSLQANAQPLLRLSPQLPAPTGRAQAALFTYIAMDDPLSSAVLPYLKAQEKSASERVHSLAFADFQGADNSLMFRIQPSLADDRVTSPFSPIRPDRLEVDGTDPAVLAATTHWAFASTPAPFRAMTVFAHGGGYFGLGTDETQPGQGGRELMSVKEFGDGLRRGLQGRRLHVLNMLSCLMGNVEFAYEMRDVAEVLIASEDSIFADSHSVEAFTGRLHQALTQPNPDARAIGRQMAIFANPKNSNTGYLTVSAVDLKRMDEVRRTVNVLSRALLAALPTQRAAILDAYDFVPPLAHDNFSQRDLWAFCNRLQAVPNPAVREAGLAVKQALRQVLLHTRDREGAAANGLSICMPDRAVLAAMVDDHLFQATLNSAFAKATAWDAFLMALIKR